jgi:hypothetical protein
MDELLTILNTVLNAIGLGLSIIALVLCLFAIVLISRLGKN